MFQQQCLILWNRSNKSEKDVLGYNNLRHLFFDAKYYALIAQRSLAERARPLAWRSSDDGRIGFGDISL